MCTELTVLQVGDLRTPKDRTVLDRAEAIQAGKHLTNLARKVTEEEGRLLDLTHQKGASLCG